MKITIDEKIRNTGIAIEQTRIIIDKSMPQVQDLVAVYEYAKYAPLFLIAHAAFENGLKALILREERVRVCGHALRRLFRRLKGKALRKPNF